MKIISIYGVMQTKLWNLQNHIWIKFPSCKAAHLLLQLRHLKWQMRKQAFQENFSKTSLLTESQKENFHLNEYFVNSSWQQISQQTNKQTKTPETKTTTKQNNFKKKQKQKTNPPKMDPKASPEV